MNPGQKVTDPQGKAWTVKTVHAGSVLLVRPGAIRWTTNGELREWERPVQKVARLEVEAPAIPLWHEGLVRCEQSRSWVRA